MFIPLNDYGLIPFLVGWTSILTQLWLDVNRRGTSFWPIAKWVQNHYRWLKFWSLRNHGSEKRKCNHQEPMFQPSKSGSSMNENWRWRWQKDWDSTMGNKKYSIDQQRGCNLVRVQVQARKNDVQDAQWFNITLLQSTTRQSGFLPLHPYISILSWWCQSPKTDG